MKAKLKLIIQYMIDYIIVLNEKQEDLIKNKALNLSLQKSITEVSLFSNTLDL